MSTPGWLRCFVHPLGGGVCWGHVGYPVFAPGSSKVAVGCVFFGLFVSVGPRICPNCAGTQLFLVPYSFFVFCRSRRGVSRCNDCSTAAKSPRSQPVSFHAPLSPNLWRHLPHPHSDLSALLPVSLRKYTQSGKNFYHHAYPLLPTHVPVWSVFSALMWGNRPLPAKANYTPSFLSYSRTLIPSWLLDKSKH